MLLGAGSSIGVQQSVFAAGEGRWLGVRIGEGEEMPTPDGHGERALTGSIAGLPHRCKVELQLKRESNRKGLMT